MEACHGRDPVNNTPHWVSALTTLYNSDLVVTGSRDGQIRIWSVGEAFKSITQIGSIKVFLDVEYIYIRALTSLSLSFLSLSSYLHHEFSRKQSCSLVHLFFSILIITEMVPF